MLTNFTKTLVWKQDYDVILWRHKQRTPNTNDYPMPLNETPPMKSFCVRHWIRQTTTRSRHYWRKTSQVRFCEIVNTCTERWAEKRIQRTAWILSHVLRKTLCEHVNGLCLAGWLNEQSITKHWFQSVRTCPYSWATDRNNTITALQPGLYTLNLRCFTRNNNFIFRYG